MMKMICHDQDVTYDRAEVSTTVLMSATHLWSIGLTGFDRLDKPVSIQMD